MGDDFVLFNAMYEYLATMMVRLVAALFNQIIGEREILESVECIGIMLAIVAYVLFHAINSNATRL